jgi:hypothetical protein
MKLSVAHPGRVRLPARRLQGVVTMVELMIASTLMMIVILGGLIAVNLLSLKQEQLLESKAGASDETRMSINQLRNDIYGAKGWGVGSWNGSAFTGITNGNLQGTALIIYPLILTSNQNINLTNYQIYYFDTSQLTNFNGLLWYYNSSNAANYILVSNLAAPLYFNVEDWQGNTQSVQNYKNVVHTTFQFTQFQYPRSQVGSNSLFNTYHIDLRATPHLPDGA